jgi:predicted lipoprotein
MTLAQLTIVENCNNAMRYHAGRARSVQSGPYISGNAARVASHLAEFQQIQTLRDFIWFGR